MARPQLLAVGTKAQFRRAVPKSFSYRYEVGTVAGDDGAPEVRSIIETRYRGRVASWTLARSMMSTEKWILSGTFLAPSPENPLTYPPKVDPAPSAEITKAAREALLARAYAARLAAATAAAAAPPRPMPQAAPAPAPAPAPAARPHARSVQRADPANAAPSAMSDAAERLLSFGRKLTTPPRKV